MQMSQTLGTPSYHSDYEDKAGERGGKREKMASSGSRDKDRDSESAGGRATSSPGENRHFPMKTRSNQGAGPQTVTWLPSCLLVRGEGPGPRV